MKKKYSKKIIFQTILISLFVPIPCLFVSLYRIFFNKEYFYIENEKNVILNWSYDRIVRTYIISIAFIIPFGIINLYRLFFNKQYFTKEAVANSIAIKNELKRIEANNPHPLKATIRIILAMLLPIPFGLIFVFRFLSQIGYPYYDSKYIIDDCEGCSGICGHCRGCC